MHRLHELKQGKGLCQVGQNPWSPVSSSGGNPDGPERRRRRPTVQIEGSGGVIEISHETHIPYTCWYSCHINVCILV